jgi:uncharacterized protein
MSNQILRLWTDIVKLHSDVESDNLPEAVFAIDLGAIAENDLNVPVVNREPEAFFRATYLTVELRRLLEEVLSSLTGMSGYNRVLKLRTPFGGGKSHTLATLLHAARSRRALAVLPEAANLPNPGAVAVAVFDGEKFDARDGKTLANGTTIRTMWGWLAWQIDREKGFPLVANHDRDRVAPGGDVIRELLTRGASDRPVLLLLDEVLKYMERAGAVGVLDSTLQRQAKDFFQSLTVEVSGSSKAAMLYSLQWSARESLGNIALLQEIDKLASRVDQLREPVTGDEVLQILQRRLLGAPPPVEAARDVAEAYAKVVTGMRRAQADTASGRQQAEEDGLKLRDRIREAYPFHPALIDIMCERWTSLDNFQRTRGALRLLASCLYALKKDGGARALLGPSEIPLKSVEVRVKMLKELGVQNEYDPVITADIEGPNARAKRIDERLSRETPALTNVKPATRLATAILAYSFGGLRRGGSGDGETLPPGVTEAELLASCVGPDMDNITATAVLSELRNACLYLHYDGVRYCFKKEANVTKLVEDAEQQVSRNADAIRERIREMLDKRLAGHSAAVVWPMKSQDLPDEEPQFLVGYMPLEFSEQSKGEQEKRAKETLFNYGERPRKYRNGVGLAVPNKKQIESLRRAVRYLLAIEKVDENKRQHRLTPDQLEQLRERRRSEEAIVESSFRGLYHSVWLPRVENGELNLEKVEVGGRPLQATGVHERMMELLTTIGTPKVHSSVTPRKIAERVKFGEVVAAGEPPRMSVRASEVKDAFYSFIDPPRLNDLPVLRKAISRGVAEGSFAWYTGPAPALGTDGKLQVNRERVIVAIQLSEDEIDFDSGYLLVPAALPEVQQPLSPSGPVTGQPTPVVSAGPQPVSPIQPVAGAASGEKRTLFGVKFRATRDQVFKAFPAIANLADKSDEGKLTIQIQASNVAGYEETWLRNAVEEPLDEADIERE